MRRLNSFIEAAGVDLIFVHVLITDLPSGRQIVITQVGLLGAEWVWDHFGNAVVSFIAWLQGIKHLATGDGLWLLKHSAHQVIA